MSLIDTFVNITACDIAAETSVTYTGETANIVDAGRMSATDIVNSFDALVYVFTLISITFISFVTLTLICTFTWILPKIVPDTNFTATLRE